MKLFWKLLTREFKLFGSNSVALLIFIGAPILYSLLIGFVYREAAVKELPIIVVDLDNTPLSNKVIDALDDNQYLKVSDVRYNTGNLRDALVQNGYHAIVTIPERFEADIQQKRISEIDADINGANMLTANYASTGIQTVLATINAGLEIETLKKKGIPSAIANQQYESFKINITRFFNPSSNYLMFLWPGMLGTIMQQVFLLVLALSFAKEFEDKTFSGLLKYSKNAWFLILTKSLPYWLLGIALWLPLIRGSFALFHVEMIQSLGAFYLVSALFILSLTFMGIAASIIFKTQLKATEVLMIVAVPSFIISGQTWPLAQMPHAIQALAQIIPLTHFLEAFRSLLLYKGTLSDILPQVSWLLGLSIANLAIAYLALRYRITSKSYIIPKMKRIADIFQKKA
jgi:ABC-2 type transport system permease protein